MIPPGVAACVTAFLGKAGIKRVERVMGNVIRFPAGSKSEPNFVQFIYPILVHLAFVVESTLVVNPLSQLPFTLWHIAMAILLLEVFQFLQSKIPWEPAASGVQLCWASGIFDPHHTTQPDFPISIDLEYLSSITVEGKGSEIILSNLCLSPTHGNL